QAALEQAGTYVEAYTKTHNYDLTTEEIQTLAGGVLNVEVLEKTRVLVGEGLRCYTKIKATVTTDKMEELAQRIRGKNVAEEYKKLQAEYARLSNELESWKQRAAKTPQGPEREAALDQIRNGEKAFARVQQKEADLFQRLVSGKQLVAQASRDKEIIDGLLKTILTSGYVVTVGDVQVAAVSGKPDVLTLKVPLSIRVSETLHEEVSKVVSAMGGTMRPDVDVHLDGGRNAFPLRFGKDTHYGARVLSNGEILRSGTRVTLVRIGKDLETANYFQDEVMRLAFLLTFLNGANEPFQCVLGPQLMGGLAVGEADWFPLRRLFPVQAIRQGKTLKHQILTMIANGTYDLEPEMNSYSGPYSTAPQDRGYVAVVRDEAIFVAQHRLPAQSVSSLTSVSVRALSITAQDELYRVAPRCAIVQ
ncbi:MAG: hypothetical protein ACRD2L_02055, partial [Terriglobia bacterium]